MRWYDLTKSRLRSSSHIIRYLICICLVLMWKAPILNDYFHSEIYGNVFALGKGDMDSNGHLYMSKAYWYDPCKGMFLIFIYLKPTSTITGSWLAQCCLQERTGFWIFTKLPPTSELYFILLRWPAAVWYGLCIPLGLTWGTKEKKISEFDWSLHREKEVKAVIPNFSYIWNVRFKICETSAFRKNKVLILLMNI